MDIILSKITKNTVFLTDKPVLLDLQEAFLFIFAKIWEVFVRRLLIGYT